MDLKRIYLSELSNHLKIGIVGPTNVGKSTLFNVMTRKPERASAVDNSLFTTIDPVSTIICPEDPRIQTIQSFLPTPHRFVPLKYTVIDTAGLLPGSFREKNGVGTDSIEAVRHADILLHMIRDYQSLEVAHWDEAFDPIRDLEMVENELMLMDLFEVEKKIMELDNIYPEVNTGEHLHFQRGLLIKLWGFLVGENRPIDQKLKGQQRHRVLFRTRLPKQCRGNPIRLGHWDIKEREYIATLNLLTAKEMIYLVNVSSWDYHRDRKVSVTEDLENYCHNRGENNPSIIQVSMEFEQQFYIVELQNQMEQYQKANPRHISSVVKIFREIRYFLSIIHFYTITDTEIKTWALRYGSTIVDAAGKIDIFLAREFLRSEVISMEDWIDYKGDRLKLTMDRKIRNEGRKYIINDGDIVTIFAT